MSLIRIRINSEMISQFFFCKELPKKTTGENIFGGHRGPVSRWDAVVDRCHHLFDLGAGFIDESREGGRERERGWRRLWGCRSRSVTGRVLSAYYVDVFGWNLPGERIVCTDPYINSKTITLTWLTPEICERHLVAPPHIFQITDNYVYEKLSFKLEILHRYLNWWCKIYNRFDKRICY